MSAAREIIVTLSLAASLLGAALFMLWLLKSTLLRLVLAALAGFMTYLLARSALTLAGRDSLASSLYFRVFGVAPRIAHAFDSDYTGEEGLVLKMPWVGIWIDRLIVIGFWTLLFGTLYVYAVSRLRPNDLTRRRS